MTYRYSVLKSAPLATWMLDDDPAYLETGGLGYSADTKSGSTVATKAAALVAGVDHSRVFDDTHQAAFQATIFRQGAEQNPFVLEAWVLPIPGTTTGPQQILSHDGEFDGLTIDGTIVKFSTKYLTAGESAVTFNIGYYQRVHLVGVHNRGYNELWVNGVRVAQLSLTDEQKEDSYVATDGFLYAGETSSNQKFAMNGVAFYNFLSAKQIAYNYERANRTVAQNKIYPQFNGESLSMTAAQVNKLFDATYDFKDDFRRGRMEEVAIDTDKILPHYTAGLSVPGSWTIAIPLDMNPDVTEIYGATADWVGDDITVESSLDGVTWSAINSGEFIPDITANFLVNNVDLEIRVSFAGGLAVDPAFLDSLHVAAFTSNIFENATKRDVEVTWPSVLRNNHEPIMYKDDNGVLLDGSELTIGTDTSSEPKIARTLELWIKPISGTPTVSVTGTKYRNGYADSTMPVGQWSLIHIVAGSNIGVDMEISGNCIVGQVSIYPTALTAEQVLFIYQSYTGYPYITFLDDDTIELSEPTNPTSIYGHDWSIDQGGGE